MLLVASIGRYFKAQILTSFYLFCYKMTEQTLQLCCCKDRKRMGGALSQECF